ncbi:TPA: hypothetical protein OT818_003617 [Citrobacter koseri]|nr:hypothetical protein [Citrobacter koseri]
MDTGLILMLIIFYLHLGWCWVSVLQRVEPDIITSRFKYSLVLVLWPLSLILSDANMEDDDDE